MCWGCWEEAGKPAMVTPAILAAVASVKRVFDLHCMGGNLHIVIDDWNLEDDHLAFCRGEVARGLSGNSHDSPLRAAEMDCLNLLEPMSEQERASVLARYSRFTEDSVAPSPPA